MDYQYQPPQGRRNYTEQDGYFTPLDVRNFGHILAADYYPNLLINSARLKSGVSSKDGKQFEYEFLQLVCVDTQTERKAQLSISCRSKFGKELLDELVFLLGLKDPNGAPGFQFEEVSYNDQKWTAEKQLPGKRIDAVLDEFAVSNGQYVRCKIVGFFFDGLSASEIAQGIPPQQAEDVERALSSLVMPRGKPIDFPTMSVTPSFRAAAPAYSRSGSSAWVAGYSTPHPAPGQRAPYDAPPPPPSPVPAPTAPTMTYPADMGDPPF